MKHLTDEEDVEIKKKLESIEEELKGKEEELRGQKELLHKKIGEFEAKLNQKQALLLQMRGAFAGMKYLTDEEDLEIKKKLEELKGKEEELRGLESLNQNLVLKERMANNELQEAREQLLRGLKYSRATICVKRMGELDGKPFIKAAKMKYGGEEALIKAAEHCALWEDRIRDSHWHPYKVAVVGGTPKEVVDENDEKLKELKVELGDEVYEAVMNALNDLNEYNPSGRYPVPELWNSSKNRKGSVKEGITHLLKQWKGVKEKRRRI